MTPEARRIGFDVLEDLGDRGAAVRVVDLGQRLGERVDGAVLELSCLLGDRFSTPRAVVVMGRERFLAEATTRPLGARARIVVLEDAGGGEDVAVVLVGGDVLVRAPHARIDGPGDAMLDLRARVPLSDHPRDRRVAEVVRVDRFLDAGRVGSAAELGANGRTGQRAVAGGGVVAVAWQLVKEGDVGGVGPWMDLLAVGPEDGPTVDDRILADRCALQRLRVRVGCVGRLVAVENDVSAEAAAWAAKFDDDPDRPDWLAGDIRRYASIQIGGDGITIYDRQNHEAWITADNEYVYEFGGGGR